MTYRVEDNKWILYRHTSNFDLISAVAVNLKNFSKTLISSEDKTELLLKLKELNYYKERNPEMPLDSINHRVNTLAYYMFGYKDKVDGKERFLFSPLGNLFLKYIGEKEKISKIFLTMLWAVQFEHPHGGTDKEFKLYPFRLIFKLLNDERISNKLFAYEVAYLVVFIKEVNIDKYETLVSEIVELRKKTNKQIEQLFKAKEHVLVNSVYEWDYYVTKLFVNAGILNATEGETICSLKHGNTETYRKVTKNYVVLNPDLYNLYEKLENKYSFLEKPLFLDDKERLKIDVVKEIYSFYPEELLSEIGLIDHELSKILELPKLIEQYANNNDGEEAYMFEEVLTDGFNMFYNIDARLIGGAGNTDIECLYRMDTKNKKFAVDAKSTKNKLSGLNAGRLAGHREKIAGEYTVVVTPRYVPAVKNDIKNTPIVIIRASTFAEYLYNCINNNVREIDYGDFDRIIVENLGTDISSFISNLTIERFAIEN